MRLWYDHQHHIPMVCKPWLKFVVGYVSRIPKLHPRWKFALCMFPCDLRSCILVQCPGNRPFDLDCRVCVCLRMWLWVSACTNARPVWDRNAQRTSTLSHRPSGRGCLLFCVCTVSAPPFWFVYLPHTWWFVSLITHLPVCCLCFKLLASVPWIICLLAFVHTCVRFMRMHVSQSISLVVCLLACLSSVHIYVYMCVRVCACSRMVGTSPW